MPYQLPDAQHLRIQRIAEGDTDLYVFTVDYGGAAELMITHRLSKKQSEALVHAIANLATDLDTFARQPGNTSVATSLEAHARTLTDQVVPHQVRELLNRRDEPLLISTTDPAIPWQLVLVGDTYLGLLRPFAVRATLRQRHEPAIVVPTTMRSPRSALLIADPSGDHEAARQEVDALKTRLLRLDPDMQIADLTQANASLQNVQLHLSQRYDLLHYAGHIEWTNAHGGERGIKLWDGVLPLSAIHRTRHEGAAVFLNGCWGGAFILTMSPDSFEISRPADPHGRPEGFGIEFARAGVRTFLAPLWPVYDHFASDLAQRVYGYLFAGKSFGEALLNARRDLQRERPWDPTWAVYVLYGHPSQPLLESMPAASAAHSGPNESPVQSDDRSKSTSGRPEEPQPVRQRMSPGARRGSSSGGGHLAAQLEHICFAEGSGRFADDAREAIALALHSLKQEHRGIFHGLDLLVAALAIFAETNVEAAPLLADLVETTVIHDLHQMWRRTLLPSEITPPETLDAAALAHSAFDTAALFLFGGERRDNPVDGIALSEQITKAAKLGAQLANEADRDEVTCGDLIEAILIEATRSDAHGTVRGTLDHLRCHPTKIIERLHQWRLRDVDDAAPFTASNHHSAAKLTPAQPGATQPSSSPAASGRPSVHPTSSIGVDLLTRASRGDLRYVRGWTDRAAPDPRSAQLDILTTVLADAASRHALVVGQRGAGVWALIEALAYRLATSPGAAGAAALMGAPLLALQPGSYQRKGDKPADRFMAFLGQSAGDSSPVILALRDLPFWFTDQAAHPQLLAALDSALGDPGRRVVVTAHDLTLISELVGERIKRFTYITVPPAAPGDAVSMIGGHVAWLEKLKGFAIPKAAQDAAAREMGPIAQPGFGLQALTLACDARLQSLSRQDGNDTVISLSSIQTLPAGAIIDPNAPITINEVVAAARRLRGA